MVFSSIDEHGRCAYSNQPRIALWNLTRLAETLLPLLADDEKSAIADAEEALAAFGPRFEATFHKGLRLKLGLFTEGDDDLALIQALLDTMATHGADFTLTFRHRLAPCSAAADAASRLKNRRESEHGRGLTADAVRQPGDTLPPARR
jgi:uncharacterized protein YdiU (UPF0061 family)